MVPPSHDQVSVRDLRLDPITPNWWWVFSHAVKLYTNRPVKSIEDLKKHSGIRGLLRLRRATPTDGTDKSAVRIKKAPQPFAHGGEVQHIMLDLTYSSTYPSLG